MSKQNEAYLGDGLYASTDGVAFKLRAPREGSDHYVVLESEVLQAFFDFVEATGHPPGDEPPEPDGEVFRGGEAAAYEAEQMAKIQRELK